MKNKNCATLTIYHFCAAHMKDNILAEGLTKGYFPYWEGNNLKPIPQCQWLTTDPDPRNQSWATQHLINYSRTAFRLTIVIPKSHHKKLVRALDFVRNMPVQDQQLVTGWAGGDKWYIYRGNIPAKWIVGCHQMENL